MYAIRYNRDSDARRWESGKPIGWVITIDGEFAFFSRAERDDILTEIRVEAMRAKEMIS